MPGIADMHCHILPGLDDGCKSMKETLKVLQEAEKQNIRTMIVTPHYHPGRYEVSPLQIQENLHMVKRRCAENNIHISLYPGQECYYFSELVKRLDSGKALTLAGSRYVLVEFEPDCLFRVLLTGLQDLKENGYIPILAHFERYSCLRNASNLMNLKERGYLLQMNFDVLRKKNSIFYKNPWRTLVEQGVVDYLGSDCHGTQFRPLHAQEACKWMEKKLTLECRDRIFNDNIEKIIKGTD